MDGVIGYLNTDLDLTSADDLMALAAAFEAGEVFPLHVTLGEDGKWYACFETEGQHTDPEPNIAAMLAVVEALAPPLQTVWAGCSRREFNIGYDCGLEPWVQPGAVGRAVGAYGRSGCVPPGHALPGAKARRPRNFPSGER